MWKKYLHDYFREYDYPVEAENEFTRVFQKINISKEMLELFNQQLKNYIISYDIETLATARKNMEVIAENIKEEVDTVKYLYYIFCSEQLKKLYAEAGYPSDYYRGVMLDMTYKLVECHNVKNIWGSFVCEWFDGFFALKRFAIGRLQYEIYEISPTVSVDGKYVFNHTEAINVHIPSSGPLKSEEVQASMKEAASFYADEFSGDKVLFMCYSWLLFPGHFEMLPKNSGIRRFMDEFTIIRVDIDFNGYDLWRIFNTFNTKNPDELPCDTSLQRVYREWLKAGKPIGEGLGIKYMDK